MAEIRGEVRKTWAIGLREHVERHNYPRNQHLEHKITFANLGGLAIWFWEEADVFPIDNPEATLQEQAKLLTFRSAINLRFDSVPLLITTTSKVLEAAVEKGGPHAPLAKQLRRRMDPPSPRGYDLNDIDINLQTKYRPDEVWLFPAHQVIELERREEES